jgi:diguanylate cyclase (GGDEF)-like protein
MKRSRAISPVLVALVLSVLTVSSAAAFDGTASGVASIGLAGLALAAAGLSARKIFAKPTPEQRTTVVSTSPEPNPEFQLEAVESARQARRKILDSMISNTPLSEIYESVCEMLEKQSPGCMCCIWSRIGDRLVLISSPSLDLDRRERLDTAWDRGVDPSIPIAIPDLAQLTEASGFEDFASLGVEGLWTAPISVPNQGTVGVIGMLRFAGNQVLSPGNSALEATASMVALLLAHRGLQDELRLQAHYDSLSGLPNRLLFTTHLTEAVTEGGSFGARFAVLHIDIDFFKQINEMFGRRIGDLYLQMRSTRLLECLGTVDMLARVGGDEFLALIHLDEGECPQGTAARLLDAMKERVCIEGHYFAGSASIGIAIFPDHAKDAENLLRFADMAMDRAKREGRNQCRLFSVADSQAADDRVNLTREMHDSLERGDFRLFYQPKVVEGKLVGFEALLRYFHPVLGIIPPSRFIPVAEDCGLIVQLGDWVLREACRQIRAWRDEGLKAVPVAVNVSARQLARGDFSATVAEALRDFDIPAHLIELELTESMLMQNIGESIPQLERLRALGCHLAIDDFGTGYSSLSYLHRLPVDALKIDRSFVSSLDEEGNTRSLVQAIIMAAHSLGLITIAEGVERDGQYAILRELQCDAMQGYLFSPPRPAADVEKLMESSVRSGKKVA